MKMSIDGNALVVRFVADIRWSDLPSGVQREVRMALLDVLGATLAGAPTTVARITADFAEATWPGNSASILRAGRRASAIGAAFANGYAANGIDIDDCARYTKGHPGAQVFPTALALAESMGLGGGEMLTAMVVGYEVAHRAARIWHDTHEVYQACGSWGSVACAAIAAHLMRLPAAQTAQALGIADYYAPNLPMMRDIDHPSMVKHGIGWGAMTGIMAAQLASRGFTGVPSLFGFPEYREWVADIGQSYIMVSGLIFKEYAACAWSHAAIDATRKLVREEAVSLDQIAHIRIEGFHETVRLGARLPETTEEAQFNVAWPLAAALLDGEIGPAQMLEHRLDDPRMRDLASKVELIESEPFNELHRLFIVGDPRGKYLSAVTITLKDGRQLSSGPVEGGIHYPQGWDEGRVEEKFRWLVGDTLHRDAVDRLVDMVWHFDELDHAGALADAVRDSWAHRR